jgi:hypothetical protein
MKTTNARCLVLATTTAALLGGCRVGSGTGAADGELYVRQCNGDKEDYGSILMPAAYHLNPEFFAGEPIEDIKKDGRDNRLIIRLQSSGKRLEVNDVVTFDIVSTLKVARCVRGRIVAGTPEYEQSSCWWGADGKGPPRIRIGFDQPIRATLAPRRTCPPPPDVGKHVPAQQGAFVVATALSDENVGGPSQPAPPPPAIPGMLGDPWRSWIEFADFGSAAQPDVPPEQRGHIADEFKVEFDQRLRATKFHIELTDDRVIKAVRDEETNIPEADIKGVLEGYFDFELARGQGAQTFP